MKIMRIKSKNKHKSIRFIDDDILSMRLNFVMESRFVKNGYTHVQIGDNLHFAKDIGEGVVQISRRVIA